jgi:hypothetical protein
LNPGWAVNPNRISGVIPGMPGRSKSCRNRAELLVKRAAIAGVVPALIARALRSRTRSQAKSGRPSWRPSRPARHDRRGSLSSGPGNLREQQHVHVISERAARVAEQRRYVTSSPARPPWRAMRPHAVGRGTGPAAGRPAQRAQRPFPATWVRPSARSASSQHRAG